jgi:hypothetical protein
VSGKQSTFDFTSPSGFSSKLAIRNSNTAYNSYYGLNLETDFASNKITSGDYSDLSIQAGSAAAKLDLGFGATPVLTAVSSSGNVGIGTTSPSQKLHVVGNLRVQGSTDCTLGAGSGATMCSSDERLKTNITIIPDSLQKILSLRGVSFDWNEKSRAPGKHEIGVIAQDVEKVFPTAVAVQEETGYKMVDYAVLVAPLIESVKTLFGFKLEQDQVNRNLASENIALKKEVDELKQRLQRIEEKLGK